MFLKNKLQCDNHCTMYSMILKYNISCHMHFKTTANHRFFHRYDYHKAVKFCVSAVLTTMAGGGGGGGRGVLIKI